jgi:hypothetical protein
LLDGYAEHYRQLISGIGGDPIAAFGQRAAHWDASTAHPLVLRIANGNLSPDAQRQMYQRHHFVLRAPRDMWLAGKKLQKVFLQHLKNLAAT